MSKKNNTPIPSVDATARDDKRRRLVKGAALGVSGITLTHWSRPVVESVVLPAHAQTTGPSSPQAQVTGAGAGSTTVVFDSQ